MIHELGPKRTSEVEWFGVDFADQLEDGETISGSLISVSTIAAGSGGSSFAAVGPSSVAGTIVRQLWGGGAIGATYQLDVQIETSAGQRLIESLRLDITA
jgi:hypothetical protein